MPALNRNAIALLSSTLVNMKTAASTALYVVPTGRVLRIAFVVVRDATASLAGGTSYSVTNFVQTFSLANLITLNTGYCVIGPIMQITTTSPAQYTETAAGVTINFVVTTGSTLAANATVDLFGYLV